jgi:TolB-like protein
MTGRAFAFLILATLFLRPDAKAQASVPDTVASPDSSSGMAAPLGTAGDTALSPETMVRLAPDSVALTRLLVLPIQEKRGHLTILRGLLTDALLDQLLQDTLRHGAVVALADSTLVPSSEVADSLGRASRAARLLWLTLLGSNDSGYEIHAQLRESYADSILQEVRVALPDTSELTLARAPRQLLLGLFPRALPPPPTLQDSIKFVAVLPFLAEGTATDQHAGQFTEDLSAQLEGRDGFRVLPKAVRDSLLGSWEPGECLTASCRLEAGQRLGVAWIVAGRLTQLGEKWSVTAELVRADSGAVGRPARARCLGAPAPSLKLVTGITTRQLAGVEAPRSELSDAPIARQPVGPTWRRLVVLGVATVLGLVGVVLSW